MSRWGHTRAGCAQHPVGRRNMGPRESSLPTRTSARRQTTWCRRMCGCGFRSEKRVHGRNKTQEEEKEQEQPKRKSLEGRVVGKTRGQKGKSHEDKVRGRGWAWLWRQDMTAHGVPAGMTPRRTGGSDSTGGWDNGMDTHSYKFWNTSQVPALPGPIPDLGEAGSIRGPVGVGTRAPEVKSAEQGHTL